MSPRPHQRSVLRAALAKSGIVVVGLVAGLVIAEAALQLGALYVRTTGREQRATWRTDRPRIVCIGDSNTYGLLEARENAYPAVLERLWNAATPAQPVEVLNLGFPGLNSSKMRQSFRDLMIALRPDLVIMLVGVNDIYTAPMPIADEAGAAARVQYALWRLSRVYRLLYMLVSRLRSDKVDTEQKQVEIEHKLMDNPLHGQVRVGDSHFDLAGTNFADPAQLGNWSVALRENVHVMAADAAAVGARFVLLTYASHLSSYAPANDAIRSMSDLPIIDVTPRFAEICPSGQCPGLFRPSQHPNANGYRIMAAVVWNGLREAGLAPPPAADATPYASLDPAARPYLEQLGYFKPAP
jgi:lysophospholipase L1-like esterase